MNEHDVSKSIATVVIAILLAGMVAIIGIDLFLDFPFIFLLWFIIGFGATAAGHLVSLIFNLVTGKDHLRLFLPVCSGVLLLGTLLWAKHESHGFMGSLGAGIIEGLFTLPVGIVFVIWLLNAIYHAGKNRRERKTD